MEIIKEDNILIEDFIKGDIKAFEGLVKKYATKVLNIVYSLIGLDKESEDIVQEVFLKVYCSLKNFRKEAKFSSWLYRITLNTVYDFLRKRKKIVELKEIGSYRVISKDNLQDELTKEEKIRNLQKALLMVPLKYRTPLILKNIEGLNYSEIAKILKCRIGTVESRIYRARQFLKKILKEDSYEA